LSDASWLTSATPSSRARRFDDVRAAAGHDGRDDAGVAQEYEP
jgi:hypothetical protein